MIHLLLSFVELLLAILGLIDGLILANFFNVPGANLGFMVPAETLDVLMLAVHLVVVIDTTDDLIGFSVPPAAICMVNQTSVIVPACKLFLVSLLSFDSSFFSSLRSLACIFFLLEFFTICLCLINLTCF